MLDLGFLPDVERILRMLPEQRHTMLFSATMPGPIIALSRAFLNRPTHIRAEEADQGSIHERTRQLVYRAHAMDKVELLTRVLQAQDRGLTMIFARTKRTVQRVADDLADRGFAAAAVHGDLGQGAREQALRAFRSGKVDVLVATDVAARGIDVIDVTHVINYQCPEDAKTYVHRIGRTGRAGKEGVAVTLVDWDEIHRWKTISDDLGLGMPEAAGDLLDLRAPVHRPHHPGHRRAAGCRTPSAPAPDSTPSTSTPRVTRAAVASAVTARRAAVSASRTPWPSSAVPARDRTRTRSRSGVAVGGGEPAPAAEPSRPGVDVDTDQRVRAEGDEPRRRRRRGRRGGAGRDGAEQPTRTLPPAEQSVTAARVRPERRRRGDVVAAVLLAVLLLVGVAVLWRTSAIAGATDRVAAEPIVAPPRLRASRPASTRPGGPPAPPRPSPSSPDRR